MAAIGPDGRHASIPEMPEETPEQTEQTEQTETAEPDTKKEKRRVPRPTRQTVQWPFQSSLERNSLHSVYFPELIAGGGPAPRVPQVIVPGPEKQVGDALVPTPTRETFADDKERQERQEIHERQERQERRRTWQPRSRISRILSLHDDGSGDERTNSSRRSLIPDYVINYLRGETPESIARRLAEERQQTEAANYTEPSPAFRRSTEQMVPGPRAYPQYHDIPRPTGLPRRSKMAGWRVGTALHGVAVCTVVAAGLAGLVLAATRTSAATLVVASCAPAAADARRACAPTRAAFWGLRVAAAAATVLVLAAAQNAAQVLASPTRGDVDDAHARRQWLDLGVPSARNLVVLARMGRGDGRTRALVAVVAVVASLGASVTATATVGVVADDTATHVTLSTILLGTTAGLAAVVVACIGYALTRTPPLATLGDAAASFLHTPDASTRGACLLTKHDIHTGVWARLDAIAAKRSGSAQSHASASSVVAVPIPHVAKRVATGAPRWAPRWACTAPRSTWLVAVLVWSTLVALASAALVTTVAQTHTLGRLGASAVHSAALAHADAPLITALLAAAPQAGLGVLYLLADTLLACLSVAREAAAYTVHRGLRVSHRPRGYQTATLHLATPVPWSLGLQLVVVGLSFALGQCLVVAAYTDDPHYAVLGFSALALVVFLALLAALGLLAALLAGRRAPDSPLVLLGGPCSAVLAARCHAPPQPPTMPLAQQQVAWGPVAHQSLLHPAARSTSALARHDVGHCTFSAAPLLAWDPDQHYA